MVNSQPLAKPNKSSDANSRQSIKVFFVTATLAATLGGWASLAAERETMSQAAPVPSWTAPRPTAEALKLEMPPLPTLVPPPTGVPTLAPLPTVQVKPAAQPTLRVVNQVPAQQVIVLGGGGGDGGGGGSAPSPVTQTGSSK
ncbi:MAG: hypothetical protein HZB51_09605 [Chloroflexi bacterium]|nr:hypothetical protein [Chloroflexota bacterium]